MTEPPTTVAAALTATGRGAIAVVAVHGPAAHRCVSACFEPATPLPSGTFAIDAIRYGRWIGPPGADRCRSGESVVVVATAADSLEVHCHGGRAAVAAILDDLSRVDAATVDADSFQLHAGASAEQVEISRILAETSTERTAAIALDQSRGAMKHFVRTLRSQLSGGDLEGVQRQIAQVLRHEPLGAHLVEPWKIMLAGPPNVGKSSLLNALLGYDRAITFAAPGTTRDVISAESAIDGWPVRMSDTAGVRETSDVLETEGVSRALATLLDADLVLLVVDIREGMTETHREIAARTSAPCLTVRNKTDLHEAGSTERTGEAATFDISATRGTGIEALVSGIGRSLVPTPPASGDPVPATKLQRRSLREAAEAQRIAQCLAALEDLGC